MTFVMDAIAASSTTAARKAMTASLWRSDIDGQRAAGVNFADAAPGEAGVVGVFIGSIFVGALG